MRPELVVEPRPHHDLPRSSGQPVMTSPYRAEHHGSWQAMDGFTDSPDRGTAELGAGALDVIVEAVAAAFVAFEQEARTARA